jgi:hypothetical protein
LKPANFANSASYGINLELNREEPRTDAEPVWVHGLDAFASEATRRLATTTQLWGRRYQGPQLDLPCGTVVSPDGSKVFVTGT